MPAYAGMTEQAERARHSKRRAFDVLIVVASASTAARASGSSFLGMLGIPSGDRVFLDALHAVTENAGDDLLGFLVARAVGVEVRLPVDDGAVRLVVLFNPELRGVVFDGQGALDYLVAVGEILGAGQLLLDLGAVLERQSAEDDIAVLGLRALGAGGMPVLDLAECAGNCPNVGRQAGSLDPLLDGNRVGRAAADQEGKTRGQGQFHHTHAFLSTVVC